MVNADLERQGRCVKAAARVLATTTNDQRVNVLRDVATRLQSHSDEILAANADDVNEYRDTGPGRDRLVLNPTRLEDMAVSLQSVSELPDPLSEIVNVHTRPNGLEVCQMRVPLGVVGVIYENRPNVTTDVAGLCLRSGNAAYLRGSSSAQRTNTVLVSIWRDALTAAQLPADAVSLVRDTDHETATAFMALSNVIDCLIPRGGPALIAAMREHARVPYVLDGDGNCHVYVDEYADVDMALAIVQNAKMSRPGVCNAAETLLVHHHVAPQLLSQLATALPGVEIRGDERTREIVANALHATTEDYETEFLDLILAVRVVDSIEDAMAHVARYGSGHSEAIVTNDELAAARWIREVDAAAVLVNASTRFIDGGELGLGAEVGISTQKLHARGPMGLRELTCLKWVVQGKGQIR